MNSYRWNELYIGMAQQFPAIITAHMMRQFLEISGDRNPLHTDANFAMEQGFDDIVVYGLLSTSFYSTLVGVYLPGRYALLQSVQVDFVKPIYTGNNLSVYGEVVYMSDATRRIEIAANIEDIDGEILSKAKLKVGLRD
jgi:3-hydroxybutyryl-CoA dehydratase